MDKSSQKFAIRIVKEAGELALSRFGKIKSSDITYKRSGKHSPVTDVDIQINSFLSDKIHAKFPIHSIISEEAKIIAGKKFTWVIDPIDGTRNYLNGNPNYSVTLAVVENDKIIFGVIYLPSLKNIYVVRRGEGVFKNGKKLKNKVVYNNVPKVFGYPQFLPGYIKLLKTDRLELLPPNRCVTKDLVDITDGLIAGAFFKEVHLWDYAAGVLMVEEMGGKVLNFSRKPYNIRSRNIIVKSRSLL